MYPKLMCDAQNSSIDNAGSRCEEHGEIFHKIFNRPTFRVKVVKDVAGVQLFGALKVYTY